MTSWDVKNKMAQLCFFFTLCMVLGILDVMVIMLDIICIRGILGSNSSLLNFSIGSVHDLFSTLAT